MATCPQ